MATSVTYPGSAAVRFRDNASSGRGSDRSASSGSSPAALLLIVILCLSTLAFGAVQPWAWGVAASVVAIALFLWAWSGARSGELRVIWTPLYLPATAFLLFGFVQFVAGLTADPIATRESLVKLSTDLVIFFLALQSWSLQSVVFMRRVVIGLVTFTGALALFSISQFFVSPGMIYGVVKPRWGGWIFGPYVNHNHYAGLMEMLIPLTIGYLFSLPANRWNRASRALIAFAAVLAAASVLLSGSRGGLIALTSELILLTLILNGRQSRVSRRRLAAAGLAGVATVALLFLWLDPGSISKRLGSIAEVSRAPDATLGERRLLARDSLRIFRDQPWLGSGLGSFATVYPRYRSFPSDREWDHAHNDYAEALAETGVAGATAILTALGVFFLVAFRNLSERLKSLAGWIGLGAALGCFGLLVHGLADFNFHIPANAAWFSLLAGFAIAPAKLGLNNGRKIE